MPSTVNIDPARVERACKAALEKIQEGPSSNNSVEIEGWHSKSRALTALLWTARLAQPLWIAGRSNFDRARDDMRVLVDVLTEDELRRYLL